MKIKNKKLFALLMLPAVIAMMVLPLCSFTTVQSDNIDVYSSYSNIQLGYSYNRGGAYSYSLYNGFIADSQRVLVDASASSASSIRDSIKFYACDYYMGDSTKTIDLRSFTVSTLSSNLYSVEDSSLSLGLCYQCDDPRYEWFNGQFIISDYHHNDDIEIQLYDYSFRPFEPIEANYDLFDVTVELYISKYNSSYNGFDLDYKIESGTLSSLNASSGLGSYSGDTVFIGVNNLVDTVLGDDYDIGDLGNEFLINTIKITLTDFPAGGQQEIESPYTDERIPKLGAIRVNSRCYLTSNYGDGILQSILSFIGDGRYQEGYNAGLSDAESVWGNLGAFLTSAVGSFFEFEIWDGFNLGAVMSIFVGAMLLVAFLKLFAGG